MANSRTPRSQGRTSLGWLCGFVFLAISGCNQATEEQQICIDAFEHQQSCGVLVPEYECPAEPDPSAMCVYLCDVPQVDCSEFFDGQSQYYVCLNDCL